MPGLVITIPGSGVDLVSLLLTPTSGANPLELVGSKPGIRLDPEGLVLPVPAYDEAYAQSIETEGGRRTRSTPQNPVASGRVLITGTTYTQLAAYARTWQQTIEAIRRNGGTLTHTPKDGNATTFDLQSAFITSMGEDTADLFNCTRRSEFSLTCLPYGRLEPSTPITASLTGPIDGFEVPAIGGSALAWGALTLTDTEPADRRFVEYGLEQDYDSGSPAPLYREATDLTPQAGSLSAPATGSFSTQNLNAFLGSAAWSIGSTGTLTHSGRWRVRLRCQGAGYMRLSYRPTGGQFIQTQKGWTLTIGTGWGSLDLGVIDVDGSWEGQIEGYAPDGGAIIIDLLEFIPVVRYAKVRAPFVAVTPTGWEASDIFDHDGGSAATGTTLSDSSHTWAGAGDSTDYTINGTFDVLQRTATSDSVPGRALTVSGLDLAAVDASVSIWLSALYAIPVVDMGLVLRYVDISNFLYVALVAAGSVSRTIQVVKRIAGVDTVIGGSGEVPFPTAPVTLRAFVRTDGAGAVYLGGGGVALFADNALAAGGTLDSGSVGIRDYQSGATAPTRFFDSFYVASLSTTEPVIESGSNFLIDQEHAVTDPSGDPTVPESFEGSYLKLDPAKTHRMVVRVRRGDDEVETDTGETDGIDASLTATQRVVLLG